MEVHSYIHLGKLRVEALVEEDIHCIPGCNRVRIRIQTLLLSKVKVKVEMLIQQWQLGRGSRRCAAHIVAQGACIRPHCLDRTKLVLVLINHSR